MIYLDDYGYPTDGFSKDHMDSAVRISILNFDKSEESLLRNYENKGLLFRSPVGYPASNPKNFSRDQLIMLIAAFNYSGMKEVARRVFWSRLSNVFFCQNTERDKNGSTKYPFPHSFYKDSNPSALTFPFWKGKVPTIPVYVGEGYPIEEKSFDGPDILLPHHVFAIILAGKMWYFYPFFILALPFLLVQLMFPSKEINTEQNQTIALASVYGKWALKLYKKMNKMWLLQLYKYWDSRNESEYAKILEDLVKTS
jgi:hypothetical protein